MEAFPKPAAARAGGGGGDEAVVPSSEQGAATANLRAAIGDKERSGVPAASPASPGRRGGGSEASGRSDPKANSDGEALHRDGTVLGGRAQTRSGECVLAVLDQHAGGGADEEAAVLRTASPLCCGTAHTLGCHGNTSLLGRM